MSRITAFLGLDVSAFSQGLAKANTAAMNFRKNLAAAGGGNIAGAIGIAALIRGFAAIVNSAQEARDAAREIGGAVDVSTLAVAQLGDAYDTVLGRLKRIAIVAISLPSLFGKFVGMKMGTASSFEEIEALDRVESGAKANDEQLAKKKLQYAKDNTQAELALAAAIKARKDVSNDTDDEAKLKRLNKEINALFTKMVETPASIVRTKIMTELEKLEAEAIQLTRKIGAAASKERNGITLSDASKASPAGRRSERERLAAQAEERLLRGRDAEASGNFSLAADLKRQGEGIAARAGFGSDGAGVGSIDLKRGGVGSGGTGDGKTWDDRFGGALRARSESLNAQYGGKYKRADSFEDSKGAEEGADSFLKQAADELKAAAKALESVEVEIDAS